MFANVEKAVKEKDADMLNNSAHRLKGALIYIAAENAAEIANQLEIKGKEKKLDHTENELEQIKKLLSEIEDFLTDYIKV